MISFRIGILFILTGCLACGGSDPTSSNNSDGPTPVSDSQYVTTNSGLKFDSSIDRGQPFAFSLGLRQVIPGWDEGVAGMRVGGKRQLVIPPSLAYGTNDVPSLIPPNATLVFEVEVLNIE